MKMDINCNFSTLSIDDLLFINGGSGGSSGSPKVTVINVGDSAAWGDSENTISVSGNNNQVNIGSSGNQSGSSSKN